MDGFDEGLNGTYDVADQLSRYLLARAENRLSAAVSDRETIDSRAAVEAHREAVCEWLRAAVGGLPDPVSEPPVKRTGRIQRDGYAIELLTIKSHSNVHVSANCYVPESEGPHPGVLFLCGHLEDPKTEPDNQRACIELVLNGFVVLVVDPICQGERDQYRDPETGEAIVEGGGGTFAHAYAGQQCYYAGTNLARYMVHDNRCALTTLAGRPDVDESRLAAVGASGGGTQAIYLGLLDDRVDAIAPCCAISTHREWLQTGRRTHAEQALAGAVDAGIDFPDLLAGLAPRPICVGAATSDRYFPIEGVHETVEQVRRLYGHFDATDRVDLVTADASHTSIYGLGEGVFEWLCDTLGDGAFRPHEDLPTLDAATLQCTPSGSVREASPDERTITDLIRADVAARFPDVTSSTVSNGGTDPQRLRQKLLEAFDLDRRGCDLHPRIVGQATVDGLDIEHVWFKTERHPDIVVAGVLVSDPDTPTGAPAMVCYEQGTEELSERRDEVASLARGRGAAFVFDPRGVGAVRNRRIPVPNWVEDDDGIYETEFKLAHDALLLGNSLLGMRVFDVLRGVDFLRTETDADAVSFVGSGIGAYHALYAAAVATDVDGVAVGDAIPSFRELATGRDVPYHPQLTVVDVLDGIDLPHVLGALDERGVPVDGIDTG
ncbi:alpha/beta hydrolase family protein [Halorhabdus amylolytica]|uniref:alpha/beta hydrolase family protein n=1 Tax=Halorhabdus amylolytica TaxID=2559573 RepID=UPI0010AB3866|nr:acetylxylan esterase [Halorhabdus amylolytica]